jgi:hypothetical protein
LRSLTSVGSDFEIYSNGIEDLHGLESLESVGGLIAIEGTAIRTLEGFSALARMSGGIYVRGNFQLTDLGPLVGVDRITGSLSLEWNGLLDYSGLRDLVAVDGYLFLAEGAARDLGGLESLRTVGQGLWLGSELESLRGIEGLTSVGGDLVLAYVALSNPSELPSTLSIGGSLRIEFPRRLTSLEGVANPRVFGGLSIAGTELENLEGLSGGNFPGGVTVQDNGRLTSLRGIEGVSLAGGLTLSNNDALTDLSALSGQTTLEHLVITSNALLSSLAGLESVESITNSLSIVPICRTEYEDWDEEMENPIRRCYGNDALMSLRALANLRSVGGNFEVRENRALASCEAEWLRDSVGVANIGGTVSVSGNTGTATCAP